MSGVSTTQNQEWNDRRWLWLFSPAIPLAFTCSSIAYVLTGQWLWLLFAPAVIHIGMPALDYTHGEDFSNPPESAVAQLDRDFFYRALVWAYVPFQIAGTIYGAWLVCTQPFPWYAYAALVFSVGSINGIGIATAHELGHKQNKLERWLAKPALAPSVYGHFFVEHNRGHHKRVATPEDPVSARMGEGFWTFLLRTVPGSLVSAGGLERERLQRKGKGVWKIDNENLQAWSISIVLYAVLIIWLSWPALIFLVLQGIYGASMLEVVNYVEQYGLLRQKDESGQYVRCAPEHSWNGNYIVGNIPLYHLQRHSDHHAHPTRRHHALRHFDEAPQLPGGYASTINSLHFAFVELRYSGSPLRHSQLHALSR